MSRETEQTTRTNLPLDGLIAICEAAGYDWAIERGNGEHYAAAIEKAPCDYMGDYLAFPSVRGGVTPADALARAMRAKGILS